MRVYVQTYLVGRSRFLALWRGYQVVFILESFGALYWLSVVATTATPGFSCAWHSMCAIISNFKSKEQACREDSFMRKLRLTEIL